MIDTSVSPVKALIVTIGVVLALVAGYLLVDAIAIGVVVAIIAVVLYLLYVMGQRLHRWMLGGS